MCNSQLSTIPGKAYLRWLESKQKCPEGTRWKLYHSLWSSFRSYIVTFIAVTSSPRGKQEIETLFLNTGSIKSLYKKCVCYRRYYCHFEKTQPATLSQHDFQRWNGVPDYMSSTWHHPCSTYILFCITEENHETSYKSFSP